MTKSFHFKQYQLEDDVRTIQWYFPANIHTIRSFIQPDFKVIYLVHCDRTRLLKKFYGDLAYDIILKRF